VIALAWHGMDLLLLALIVELLIMKRQTFIALINVILHMAMRSAAPPSPTRTHIYAWAAGISILSYILCTQLHSYTVHHFKSL
jgi:hypothetical protein